MICFSFACLSFEQRLYPKLVVVLFLFSKINGYNFTVLSIFILTISNHSASISNVQDLSLILLNRCLNRFSIILYLLCTISHSSNSSIKKQRSELCWCNRPTQQHTYTDLHQQYIRFRKGIAEQTHSQVSMYNVQYTKRKVPASPSDERHAHQQSQCTTSSLSWGRLAQST